MIEVNQYLNKGFIWDGKYTGAGFEVPKIKEIDYEDAKKEFWNRMDDVIAPLAIKDNTLFTMSSGLDTSSILSHVVEYDDDPNVVCLDNGRGDAEMAQRLADDWNFSKLDIVIVDPNKIESDLLEINSILSSPVAHTYIFFSYYLFKYAKEKGYDTLVMGDGPDVSMLGTHALHQDIIENAIRLKQYDLEAASEVIEMSNYSEPCVMEHSRLLWNALKKFTPESKYNTLYFYNTWSENEIIGDVPKWELEENTIEHRIWAEWVQFLVRTRKPTNEMLKNFSFKQVSPYMLINDFIMSLPVHYRYCLHSTKHLMVDLYGDYLPLYIIQKTRTGFNPSDPWAKRYKEVINYMLNKWVWEDERKIHKYVDVKHMYNGFFTFNQKWSLINLSMWLELHDI